SRHAVREGASMARKAGRRRARQSAAGRHGGVP
ncbi:hypothetical protein GTY88_41310, partial [Streptomyces sp. SID5926]|nr:hypothetical protein [Streptomyces sp. SID5926]